MKIAENILAILAECRVEGNTLYLPEGQLERKTYEAVNKCLANIGGKWNRKAKGHVFDYPPGEALENLVLTGETEDMKKALQFFPTPRPVAEMVCDMADLSPGDRVLEPSCGKGDLADVVYERGVTDITGVEINPEMDKYLAEKPYPVLTGVDFLALAGDANVRRDWSRVVMNPPFARQQDIDHIRAAFELLRPGGVLVSVISPSPFFRANRKSVEFREWLDDNVADIVDVPAGAFKDSGTSIATKIIKLCA